MENIELSPISTSATMNVSGILNYGGKKAICVMIEDGSKSIEVRLPDGEILSRKGYTENEAEEILSYLSENMDDIMKTAREINPMAAFLK